MGLEAIANPSTPGYSTAQLIPPGSGLHQGLGSVSTLGLAAAQFSPPRRGLPQGFGSASTPGFAAAQFSPQGSAMNFSPAPHMYQSNTLASQQGACETYNQRRMALGSYPPAVPMHAQPRGVAYLPYPGIPCATTYPGAEFNTSRYTPMSAFPQQAFIRGPDVNWTGVHDVYDAYSPVSYAGSLKPVPSYTDFNRNGIPDYLESPYVLPPTTVQPAQTFTSDFSTNGFSNTRGQLRYGCVPGSVNIPSASDFNRTCIRGPPVYQPPPAHNMPQRMPTIQASVAPQRAKDEREPFALTTILDFVWPDSDDPDHSSGPPDTMVMVSPRREPTTPTLANGPASPVPGGHRVLSRVRAIHPQLGSAAAPGQIAARPPAMTS